MISRLEDRANQVSGAAGLSWSLFQPPSGDGDAVAVPVVRRCASEDATVLHAHGRPELIKTMVPRNYHLTPHAELLHAPIEWVPLPANTRCTA